VKPLLHGRSGQSWKNSLTTDHCKANHRAFLIPISRLDFLFFDISDTVWPPRKLW
jgi:hypothetical protein